MFNWKYTGLSNENSYILNHKIYTKKKCYAKQGISLLDILALLFCNNMLVSMSSKIKNASKRGKNKLFFLNKKEFAFYIKIGDM